MPDALQSSVAPPVRRRLRARHWFGFACIAVLALSFVRTNEILFFVTILTYAILLTAIVDTLLMWRGLRKRLTAKFGEEAAKAKGNGMYAAMRAFQLRRSRMPRALVKRGEYPA